MSAGMCIYLYVCINCVFVHECVTSLHVQLRVDDCTYLYVCAHMCMCENEYAHVLCRASVPYVWVYEHFSISCIIIPDVMWVFPLVIPLPQLKCNSTAVKRQTGQLLIAWNRYRYAANSCPAGHYCVQKKILELKKVQHVLLMPQNICDKTPLSAVFATHICGEEHLRSALHLADQTLCDLHFCWQCSQQHSNSRNSPFAEFWRSNADWPIMELRASHGWTLCLGHV